MATPDYITTEEISFYYGSSQDFKVLPKGAFVRPVSYEYVPRHVIDHPMFSGFDKKTHVFCYSRLGFIPVAKKIIQEK